MKNIKTHDVFKISFGALLLLILSFLVASCGKPEAPVPLSSSTAVLFGLDFVKHDIKESEADFLATLVSQKPDVDTTDQINLLPIYKRS